MASIRLEVVTAERTIFSDDVDVVVAPGIDGQLGILPHHAPLMTMLAPGELTIRKGNEDTYLFVAGGFLEVRPDRVIVLADAAERAEEIDVARAEAAKRRAEEALTRRTAAVDTAAIEAALRRSMERIRISQRRRPRQRT